MAFKVGHLVLFCQSTVLPDGVDLPMMILDAGMDADEVPVSGMLAPPTARLMWLYPAVDPERLAKQVGSVDFDRRLEAGDYETDSESRVPDL